MRGHKLAVVLLAVWSLGLTLFAINLRHSANRNQESVGTLMNLLEIHSWEVPMPKDPNTEWSFELRDYRESKVVAKGKDDWMDFSKKAKIVFMPTGEESIHRFWFIQTKGTSSGKTRVDVCDAPAQIYQGCDAGQLEYVWYPAPERIEDGRTYILCDIKETLQTLPPQRRKQLVLHLVRFRLELVQTTVNNMQETEVVDRGEVGFPLRGFIGFTNTGTPVKGMLVECFVEGAKKPVKTTSTDASGHFSFPDLLEGKYYLRASQRGIATINTVVSTGRRFNNVLSLVTEACSPDSDCRF